MDNSLGDENSLQVFWELEWELNKIKVHPTW